MHMTKLIFLGLIGLITGLSAFSLVVNNFMKVREQSEEVALFRALGLKRFRVALMHSYEALTVTLASSIVGILCGFATATVFLEMQE